VYLAWEGGGSASRRSLYPEYKMNRKPEKLNRFYGDDIPDSEDNKKHQLIALLSMLKTVPVCQIYTPNCEGDDVIAYLCNTHLKNEQVNIVSSDKDLYQLLNPTTKIYNLHKKTFVLEEDIFSEYKIQAKHFAIAKALCGDPGDNVPGIKGLGFKTVAKLYPFLGSENEVILQDVLDYAASHITESKFHRMIVEQQDDVKRNWKLVFLDGSLLSHHQTSQIDHLVNTFKPKIDKIGLVKQLIKEGIGDFDVDGFFYAFNCIDNVEYGSRND